MRKYIIRIILFFTTLILIDIFFGKAFDNMVSHAKGGDTKETYDFLMNDEYDVIIMGSSRATRHYIPSLIENLTGMTCYNAGKDGNGIILMYGRYKLITNRYTPKVILYDVEPAFDIYEYNMDDNNRRYLADLKPYFFYPGIKEIFKDVGWTESMKSYSSMFRYNGSYLHHFSNYLNGKPSSDNGYLPLQGSISYEPEIKESSVQTLDTLKLSYMRKIAKDAQSLGIEFIFLVSPKFETDYVSFQQVQDIANELGISFIDYSKTIEFQKREYFRDPKHLNDDGAKIYTREISENVIKKI